MVVTPNVGNKCIAGINDSIFKITYSTIPQIFYIVDWELLIDELERYDRCQIYKCSNLLTPTYFSNKVFDSKLPCSYSFQSLPDIAINQIDIHYIYINVPIISYNHSQIVLINKSENWWKFSWKIIKSERMRSKNIWLW